SGARATAQFKVVEPRPWLELAPWWGPAGVPVGFHGGGWAAGERITFHVDSAMTPAVVEGQADDGGWLRGAGPATVPPDATRKVTFVAVGGQSHAVATATFTVSAPSAGAGASGLPRAQPGRPRGSPGEPSARSPRGGTATTLAIRSSPWLVSSPRGVGERDGSGRGPGG